MEPKVKLWPAVRKQAVKLRKLGCSYSEIARQLEMQGFCISKQYVWLKLKEEGL